MEGEINKGAAPRLEKEGRKMMEEEFIKYTRGHATIQIKEKYGKLGLDVWYMGVNNFIPLGNNADVIKDALEVAYFAGRESIRRGICDLIGICHYPIGAEKEG